MIEIKAAGSEVYSEFIFMEVVGELIDYLLLGLSSLRKPSRGSMQLQPSLLQVQRNMGDFVFALKRPKLINSKGNLCCN